MSFQGGPGLLWELTELASCVWLPTPGGKKGALAFNGILGVWFTKAQAWKRSDPLWVHRQVVMATSGCE